MGSNVTKTDIDEVIDEILNVENQIIVYNDDVNSFENVIMSFINRLNHTFEQSEQLAIIIHNKGKASVKKGSYEELQPLCSALLDDGLSAEIE